MLTDVDCCSSCLQLVGESVQLSPIYARPTRTPRRYAMISQKQACCCDGTHVFAKSDTCITHVPPRGSKKKHDTPLTLPIAFARKCMKGVTFWAAAKRDTPHALSIHGPTECVRGVTFFSRDPPLTLSGRGHWKVLEGWHRLQTASRNRNPCDPSSTSWPCGLFRDTPHTLHGLTAPGKGCRARKCARGGTEQVTGPRSG